jgi:hypothetical protein
MPDRYFRLGFGWPSLQDLEKGLDSISKALPNRHRAGDRAEPGRAACSI